MPTPSLPQVTLDTGALIALERRKQRAVGLLKAAVQRGLSITVPTVVLAEWWRERTAWRTRLLDTEGLVVEPLTEEIAVRAGEALARVPGATTIDAIVMASAAARGDIVYTSDAGDLERLRQAFPAVRVLGV